MMAALDDPGFGTRSVSGKCHLSCSLLELLHMRLLMSLIFVSWQVFLHCTLNLEHVSNICNWPLWGEQLWKFTETERNWKGWIKPKGFGLPCHKVWDVGRGESGLLPSLLHSSPHTQNFGLLAFSRIISFSKLGGLKKNGWGMFPSGNQKNTESCFKPT